MHKILVRHSQTLPQVYLGLPAQCIQPGAVHELAQGAVGLGGVIVDVALALALALALAGLYCSNGVECKTGVYSAHVQHNVDIK